MFSQLKRSIAIAKKNLRIYYMKGPVIIFGILLPFFFFLSFWMGRDIPAIVLGTGLVGMAIWFTSTSISPVITPWETRTKTLERLVSSPVGIPTILLGDVLSSAFIGIVMTVVPLGIALVFLDLTLVHPLLFGLGILLASFCFSSIGVLMSSLPTDTPADVMMLSTLVKFPVIFISGIFIPIDNLPAWGETVSHLSPLTYFTQLARYSFGTEVSGQISPLVDLGALVVFTMIFMSAAVLLHRKTLPKRI